MASGRNRRRGKKKERMKAHVRGRGVSSELRDDELGTKDGVFVPSERQHRFVALWIEHSVGRFSVVSVCKAAGITRQAFYLWMKQPGFLEWFNGYRERLSNTHMMAIDKMVHLKAERGDLAAARMVYEKRGELHKRVDLDMVGALVVPKDQAAVDRLWEMLDRMRKHRAERQRKPAA